MTEEKEQNTFQNAATEAWSKNWLVPMLLLMLREWNSYGYELMEKMAAFGMASMNPGTFYRTLRQMEKDGMVSSRWDTSEGGPARRMYSITSLGEAYLKYWADSLNQYQKLMDTFFRFYTGTGRSGEENNKEQNNG
ncbi:MAG TPA: poly-beta-hydroxybutyrate-responsive repressor [Ktedonobacteraceae bacterium]|jgi:poly-beta-hydroxybutyrate-responsive repressor|nr:poly-beta-hydroxybutyrate-responsive repressor [Ktedonobacteraceae bacterium]